MSIKTCLKIEMIVFYFFIKKNPKISFRNGLEHETTSLREVLYCLLLHFSNFHEDVL